MCERLWGEPMCCPSLLCMSASQAAVWMGADYKAALRLLALGHLSPLSLSALEPHLVDSYSTTGSEGSCACSPSLHLLSCGRSPLEDLLVGSQSAQTSTPGNLEPRDSQGPCQDHCGPRKRQMGAHSHNREVSLDSQFWTRHPGVARPGHPSLGWE